MLRALLLLAASAAAAADCPQMPLTNDLVNLLVQRNELMSDVAAQKADFSLVFDSAQELEVLEKAQTITLQTTLPSTAAVLFAQVLADCAKHIQEAHIQAAVDEAEAAGELVTGEDGEEGHYGTMTSDYESLDDVRSLLSQLNDDTLERWQLISQPNGEWDQAGCACTHATLTHLFATEFQPKALGGCGSELYSEMLMWVLLSASPTCRI